MGGESSNWEQWAEFIKTKILHRPEDSTLEKKREHYYLDEGMVDADGNPVDPLKKRAELLKDLIALANAAHRRGTSAYLCLGIAEGEDWSIFGVEGRHPKKNPRPPWSEVEKHPDLINKWVESIQRAYVGFAKQYIAPTIPDVDYETGWVEGHLIGLLVLRPFSEQSEGFYLTEEPKKAEDLKKLGLKPGYSWRRLGATTVPVEPAERWILKSSKEYPYIPLEGWTAYLRGLLTKYEYRPEPNQPDSYQPLQAQYENNRGPVGLIENVTEFLDRWAHSNEEPRVLLITGRPGCGKTTLLQRLARDLADEALQAIRITHERPDIPGHIRALDYPKDTPIPVLISLWDFDPDKDVPQNSFRRAMTDYGGKAMKIDRHPLPANLLKDRDLTFVVMLDGLDEMVRHLARQWKKALSAWARFVQDHPNARFLITCRDDQLKKAGPLWNAYPRILLKPLHPIQVRQHLITTDWIKLLDQEDIPDNVIQLLRNPRYLNSLRESETPVQSIGVALRSMIEGFWEEELKKHPFSNQSDQIRLRQSVTRFAFNLLTQGRRKVGEGEVLEMLGRKTFEWLYRSGFLVSDHQNDWMFIDPIVHDYFAARQINEICRSNKKQKLSLVTGDEWWQRAIHIALNIWPEDLTAEPVASLLSKLEVRTRVRAIAERQFRIIGNELVEQSLYEYLQCPDVDLGLVEQLLTDGMTQLATIQAIQAARYTPAADILYNIECQARGEVRSQIASILSDWGDPRGEQLQPEDLTTQEEAEEILEESLQHELLQFDESITAEPLKTQFLQERGGQNAEPEFR